MSENHQFLVEAGVLKKYTGPGGKVTVPAEITVIGGAAFQDCHRLTEVLLPEGVTQLGDWAFSHCERLKRINIPKSVSRIGWYAFAGCERLETVTVPEGVQELGNGVFVECARLRQVELPDSLRIIGNEAFYRCGRLESVTIPEGVTRIGKSAFERCGQLTEITVPASVREIGWCAFYKCSKLTAVTVREGVTAVGDNFFADCESLISVTLPESIRELGCCAFLNCRSLKEATLLCSLSRLPHSTFRFCPELESVTIRAGLEGIGSFAFEECEKLTRLELVGRDPELGTDVFYGCRSLADADGRVIVGTVLYHDITDADHVVVPEGITRIGREAIGQHRAPRSITLPGSLQVLEPYALPKGVQILAPQVPMQVLEQGERMQEAVLGYLSNEKLYTDERIRKDYEKYILSERRSLLPMILERDMPEGLLCYAKAKKLTPKSFERYYLQPAMAAKAHNCVAFLLDWKNKNIPPEQETDMLRRSLMKSPYNVEDMRRLWSYEKLPDGTLQIRGYKGEETAPEVPPMIGKTPVTSIGEEAFSPSREHLQRHLISCLTELTEVTVPDSVTDIGKSAFYGCPSLETVRLPSGLRRLRAATFANCRSLRSIVIPEGVERIGVEAFSGCAGLEYIFIPGSVERIPDSAFLFCIRLTVHGPAGSYAEKFAKSHDIPFVAE